MMLSGIRLILATARLMYPLNPYLTEMNNDHNNNDHGNNIRCPLNPHLRPSIRQILATLPLPDSSNG